jgi:RHS repeat-associated protein
VNDVATALPVVLQESGPDGAISYAYGLGLISETSSAFNYFYHYDGLGSIVGLTDSSGKLAGRYAYDAWGNADLTVPAPQLGTGNKFRFTGEALDPGTQLYYLRARYYDPTVGRFLAQDPVGFPLHSRYARNAYAYAVNNPSRFTDHTGLSAKASNNPNLMAMTATSVGNNFLSGLKSWLDIAEKILLNAADSLTPSVTGPLSNTDTVEVLATWGASEIAAAKLLKTESPSAFVNSVETYLTSGSNPTAAVRQSFIDLGFLPSAPWVSSPIESELLKLLGTYYDPHITVRNG